MHGMPRGDKLEFITGP